MGHSVFGAATARQDHVIAGRSLRSCVADRGTRALELLRARPSAQPAFVEAARHHGIPGYAWRATGGAGVLTSESDRDLQAGFYWAVARHLRTLTDLRRIGAALDGAAVDWLVFKGPVLADVVHGEPGLRGYSDLDVLVRPRHLGRALEALEEAGGITLDKNWDLLLRELRGEVHMVAPQGTVVDLHWHLINQPRPRRPFQLQVDELLDRRVPVEIGGLRVPTFDATDAVIHLALHTVLSGCDRLVWFKDIERSLANRPPDWAALANRCARWRTGLAVDVALRRTSALITPEAPIQPQVSPPTSRVWVMALQTACALSLGDPATTAGSLTRVVSRSTAQDLGASSVELVRKCALAVRAGHLWGTSRRVEADSAGSMHHDAGGPATRRAFLDAVEGQSAAAHSSIRT